MNNIIKKQLQPYLFDYLKKVVPNFEKKGKMFLCPFHSKHEDGTEKLTANEFPPDSGKIHCFSPSCGKIGDIISICRELEFEGCKDVPDEDVAEYLIDMFNIKVNNHVSKVFDNYEKWQWDMVPVAKNDKASNVEREWQIKSHKNRSEWEQWYQKINMGVKTGKMSKVLCLDFDFVSSELKKRIYAGKPTKKMIEDAKIQWDVGYKMVKEKLSFLDWTTVQQKTFGGLHLFYKYDERVPKTAFNYEGIHIDIESEGGQVVIEPSIVGGQNRVIEGEEVKILPEEIVKFILEHSAKIEKVEVVKEKNDNLELTFENLNSNRNNTFLKLYGIMRKNSTIKIAYNHLKLFNGLLDKKLPIKELQAMTREAEKYHKADINSISEQIIDHFKIVQSEVHLRDLKEVLNIERKDIEEALRFLLDEKKIYKIKKDLYKMITDVEWRTDFMTISKPLDIKIPYFEKYANFNQGSLIVVGGKTGQGKSHCVVNMIEQFVKQGICPKLISTEADSGIGEIALARGLKEGDFKFWQTTDPTNVPFQENEVRIIDWLKAKNSEFWKLDSIYEELNNNLVNFGGLLIVFAQLKKENNQFYAENMVEQFASLVAKFTYPEINGQVDNLHPYFQTTKIRRPKNHQQYLKIPLEYNTDTKELKEK